MFLKTLKRMIGNCNEIAHPSIRLALAIFFDLILEVNSCAGIVKTGRRDFRLLTVGKEPWVDYPAELVFGDAYTKNFVGKINLFQALNRYCSAASCLPDIIVIRMNRFLGKFLLKQGFIAVPEFIDFKQSVSTFSVQAEGARKIIENKLLIEQKYTYQIKKELSDLELFYSSMYLPYIKQRFGKYAVISSFLQLKRLFAKGALLFVFKNGKPVSGLLYYVNNKEIYFGKIGIDNGDLTLVKEGALEALYCFFTKIVVSSFGPGWVVNFGAARPFLNDGIFRYKHKWCPTTAYKKDNLYNYYFKFKNYEDSSNFFKNNPFVQSENNLYKPV